jgi:hypothetical protein
LSNPAMAQSYSFRVEEERIQITIIEDGSIDIEYWLTFTNYEKLDGVDIGLPNNYYNLNSARALIYIDDNTYHPQKIHKSPYVDIGVAVEFTSIVRNQIEYKPGGKEFTLYFQINNPHMVYEDEKNHENAGIKFRPTWFDDSFQRGNTKIITIDIILPARLNSTESIKYLEGHPYDSIIFNETKGKYVASWSYSNISPAGCERGDADAGISFTKSAVDKYYTITFWDHAASFLIYLMALLCVIAPILLFVIVIAWIIRQTIKRQMDYFEPELSVVGAGPRRDLTAVEAAIVLERPLDKVATMILFGLRKKGKIGIVTEVPLVLSRISIQNLRDYERDFFSSILSDGTVDYGLLKKTLVNLIKAVQKKIRGFDYSATKQYYRSIVERAWAQVSYANTPEVFQRSMENNYQWILLDKDYDNRLRGYYLPIHDVNVYHGSGSASSYSTQGIPNIRSIAEGYITHVESVSRGLVSNLQSLSQSITQITNPPPAPSSGGGFSGGGGGCACACACACAGGGR